jgi:hypothetical protein
MERLMPRWNSWDLEPEPNVPTPNEIQIAEDLRRQLQLKLLPRADAKTEQSGDK